MWFSIVHERRIMKSFAVIDFKQKWIMIMPFCSPTHSASDWYWTLTPPRSIYDCQFDWRMALTPPLPTSAVRCHHVWQSILHRHQQNGVALVSGMALTPPLSTSTGRLLSTIRNLWGYWIPQSSLMHWPIHISCCSLIPFTLEGSTDQLADCHTGQQTLGCCRVLLSNYC